MIKVTWVVNYIGGGCFKATVAKESELAEHLKSVDNNVVDTNLEKLKERAEILTKNVVDSFDHYGKFVEGLEVRFEFTGECISQLESMINMKASYGCTFILLLTWFTIYHGFILIKWFIATVLPNIKVFLSLMFLNL